MLGSKNMLGKAIKHLNKQNKARKSYKEKRVWIVAKKLHPHPWTSNPRYGTKEMKIECKNTTFKIIEKRWESKVFEGVLMCLRENSRDERERICPKIVFCKMRALGSFILKKWHFSFQRTLKGRWPPCWCQQFWPFLGSTLDTYLKAFLDSDWADIGVPRKL